MADKDNIDGDKVLQAMNDAAARLERNTRLLGQDAKRQNEMLRQAAEQRGKNGPGTK
jgi:hypothetical protein